jgi:S1-C subfamily serine protease
VLKTIAKVAGVMLLGALGALIFNVSLMPYMLASTYFENLQFIKDFKAGKIVVNKTDQVYIQENKAIEQSVVKAESSVVAIQSYGKLSSGFIATSDGSIVTIASSVTGVSPTLYVQGKKTDFTVVKIDNKSNLALLKINSQDLQTTGFANSDTIKLGQKVFLVVSTSPDQSRWLANEGIVREVSSSEFIRTNIIEKSVANGSPLFDSSGQLVGINFIDSEGKVSAIPINNIRTILGI